MRAVSASSRSVDLLIAAASRLRADIQPLKFSSPVTHVYNPLDYAWETHKQYLRRFGDDGKRVVFVGMNPGPWGMVQTGVPFGEIQAVKDWLGIAGNIRRPASEHPKRPVQGFDCTRREISGQRLWGLFANRFGKPEAFFREHFVVNYCPLAFLEETGRNRTPDKLPADELRPVYEACDRHLLEVIKIFQPEWLIGVGAFAETRCMVASETLTGIRVGRILHPSPASPVANRGWAEAATRQLEELLVW